jgi:hypothetical protein
LRSEVRGGRDGSHFACPSTTVRMVASTRFGGLGGELVRAIPKYIVIDLIAEFGREREKWRLGLVALRTINEISKLEIEIEASSSLLRFSF